MTSGEAAVRDLIRVMDAVSMTAYAGATWDWTQIHLDLPAAQAAGFQAPVVDGQMLGALLASHALGATQRRLRVVEMSFRHAAPVLRGDRIRVSGRILSDDGETCSLHQDVDVIDASGTPSRRAISSAKTTLATF